MISLSPLPRRLLNKFASGCVGLGLVAVSGSTLAAGYQGAIEVRVTYELRVPLASTDLDAVQVALDQSGKMVYHRINLECQEMLKQFAASCELSKLNVQHGNRAGRRAKDAESVYVRANANFAVQLRQPQQ